MTSEPVGSGTRGSGIPNIPGNAHKVRQEQATPQTEEREKLEKIVTGKVIARKPPWYKRVARSMIADDTQNIGDYLVQVILIPTAKNLIRDVIVGGTDRTLYGPGVQQPRGVLGSAVRNATGSTIRTRYDKMAEGSPRVLTREARARHDFHEIVLDTREEAMDALVNLEARRERYGSATVSDLYDLVGVTGSYADQRWGWTDLSTADVRQQRGGWLLDMPAPENLRP